jgi:hypothetical protein
MYITSLPADVVSRMPTPKGTALKILRACRRTDCHLRDLGAIVRTDPALSGRLIALSNSAMYGGERIVSIDDAVARLGTKAVSNVAVAFSLVDQHSSGRCLSFNYATFWSESLLMASASQHLGVAMNLGTSGSLFTVGLLAQIGKLALATAFPVEYSKLLLDENTEVGRMRAEITEFGFSSIDVTLSLMSLWGIPSDYSFPFSCYGSETFIKVNANARYIGRLHLAKTAWLVTLAISANRYEELYDGDSCIQSLRWLKLENDMLISLVNRIVEDKQSWLVLISKGLRIQGEIN